MPKLKPGQRIEWIRNYCTLGGGGRTIREQVAPAAMPMTMPTATMPPAAPKPAAPKLTVAAAPAADPREAIFDAYTDRICDLIDDESADAGTTGKAIAALLLKREAALAAYDDAVGTENAKPAAIRKSPKPFVGRSSAKRVDLGLDPHGPHVVAPENVDDGLEHFLGNIRGRGLNRRASSHMLENVRTVQQGEEYLTEESRLAPDTTKEFLAGLRIIRE